MASAARFAFLCLLICGCSRPRNVYRVRFETSKGDVVIQVRRDWAPLGADRFYTLVRSAFYDGARFFRVLPGFVVQFGIPSDPVVTRKWRDTNLKDDPVKQSNARGTVSFATDGPNSRTTQVFINLGNNATLDQKGFAPFGAVVGGMNVVDQFYSEYGEGEPRGKGPAQPRIEAEGNAYLECDFPKLDYIKRAAVQQ
ncbi:MAG: peptidylprolyl isomerase [Acidobacteria bacterium]|nr:MAG: peptidylprolyl isomerase [Acidobacteriota bacterium]